MFGDTELILIGVTASLWLLAGRAFALRRRRLGAGLALTTLGCTIAILMVLRGGTGHRA